MAKAQKGDLIRVIALDDGNGNTEAFGENYKIGDILEVESIDSYADGDVTTTANECYLYDHEYEIHRKAGEEGAPKTSSDAVNPQHYKQGRTEVIDIIEDAVMGAEPFEAVCQANVLKYTLRYRHKNGVEDLKKAVWYAEKLIAYLEENK